MNSVYLGLLIFSFLYKVFGCQIESNKDMISGDSYEIKYITAGSSGLLVREKPSFESRKNNLLPQGTEVRVKKTAKLDTYKKNSAYWYYSDELGGYMFGSYLSNSRNGKENLEITSHYISGTCNSDNISSWEERLILANGNVLYRVRDKDAYNDKAPDLEKKGKYTANNNSILIDFEDNSILEIIFSEKAGGFLKKEDIHVLEDRNYIHDKKNKAFIFECNINDIGGKFESIGYFYN